MCATKTEQGLRRLTTLRAHSRVPQVCHVIVGFHVLRVDVSLDLGFHVVTGVGRLTVQQKGLKRQLHFTTHTQFQVQNSFFWMLQSDFVMSSSTQSVSQILAYFTSRKTGLLKCCLYNMSCRQQCVSLTMSCEAFDDQCAQLLPRHICLFFRF